METRTIAFGLETLRRRLEDLAARTGSTAVARAATRLDAALDDLTPELVREEGECLSR
jgi:hypothetical protein